VSIKRAVLSNDFSFIIELNLREACGDEALWANTDESNNV